jgi:AcrR family transcriptional regulator
VRATTGVPQRLPAAQRRLEVVDAALRVFASGSYAGATTAEIARCAGVSEPIIYRHFASKRDLWFACLDEAWERLRRSIEERIADLGDADGVRAVGQTGQRLRRLRALLPNLWIQGITEAGEDGEIQRHVRRHMREVHGFIADVIRRSQAAGGVPADRDAAAEAWIFIAGGLLVSFADRVGGVLSHDDFAAIASQRYRWLLGDPEASG